MRWGAMEGRWSMFGRRRERRARPRRRPPRFPRSTSRAHSSLVLFERRTPSSRRRNPCMLCEARGEKDGIVMDRRPSAAGLSRAATTSSCAHSLPPPDAPLAARSAHTPVPPGRKATSVVVGRSSSPCGWKRSGPSAVPGCRRAALQPCAHALVCDVRHAVRRTPSDVHAAGLLDGAARATPFPGRLRCDTSFRALRCVASKERMRARAFG